jgi:hypothetical protein
MEMKDEEQIWVAAYSGAIAMVVLGNAIANPGVAVTPGGVQSMDTDARMVADRVRQTIVERAAIADAQLPKKGARS